MSEHDKHAQQPDEGAERDEQRPMPDQHDPTTEEDTASGGAPQPPA